MLNKETEGQLAWRRYTGLAAAPNSLCPTQISRAIGEQEITVTNTNVTPWQQQVFTIDLGNGRIELCKIGDYRDRIFYDEGKWYLKKQIKKLVLNGSENWGEGPSGEKTLGYFSNIIGNNVAVANYGISDHFNIKTEEDLMDGDEEGFSIVTFYPGTGLTLGIRISNKVLGGSGVNALKNWLSTNNVVIYYVLVNAEITEITDVTLLNSLNELIGTTLLNGANIISISSVPSASTHYDENYLNSELELNVYNSNVNGKYQYALDKFNEVYGRIQ
jgi:hypothetical protein